MALCDGAEPRRAAVVDCDSRVPRASWLASVVLDGFHQADNAFYTDWDAISPRQRYVLDMDEMSSWWAHPITPRIWT